MDKKDPKVYADSPEGRLKNADIHSEGWCTKGEVIGDIAQVIAPFAWAKLSKAGECVKVVEVASEGEKGGGIQYEFSNKISELLQQGILRKVEH